MSINITKYNSANVLNTKYGKIPIVNKLTENYIHFDNADKYKLCINENLDIQALDESNTLEYEKEIQFIKGKYDVSKIEWLDSENAIVIKGDNNVLLDIVSHYQNNKLYTPNLVTDNVLFLETDDKISLDENNDGLLDKLSDSDMKNIIQKSGIKLNGTENKDRLKGIIQGAIATNK